MNIWIIDHYAIKPTGIGITRQYSLAKGLVKKGHKVTIVASNFQHRTGKFNTDLEGAKYKEEFFDGIRFIWIDTPSYVGNSARRVLNMMLFALRARFNKALLDKDNKPDVVIGSSPHPFAVLAAERLASHHKVPFVMEVRDLWPQALIDLGGISKYHPFILLLARLEKYLYTKAKRIIILLPGAVEYIKSLGIQDQKIVWIPNGIDTELLSETELEKKANDKFIVMYTGAHGLANNLDTILRAAKVLQDSGWGEKILFRLVGDGPEKPALMELAEKMCLNNVLFEDPVPKKEVYKRMAEADVFVATLKKGKVFKWGISPNKIYDYLAMARPIVFATDAFNNPVEEASAGISVPPEDPKSLANAIVKLYSMSEQERVQMGIRGRRYVVEKHDFNVLVDRLEGLLCNLLHGNKPEER